MAERIEMKRIGTYPCYLPGTGELVGECTCDAVHESDHCWHCSTPSRQCPSNNTDIDFLTQDIKELKEKIKKRNKQIKFLRSELKAKQ